MYDCYENSGNFNRKNFLVSDSKKKHHLKETTLFTFFSFQILYASFNTIKKLSKFLLFKNNLNFLKKNGGFVPPSPKLNFC